MQQKNYFRSCLSPTNIQKYANEETFHKTGAGYRSYENLKINLLDLTRCHFYILLDCVCNTKTTSENHESHEH